jgi:hypothetical protein
MLSLLAFSCFIGIVLGSRYKVLVLVPATLCAIPIAIFVGFSDHGTIIPAIVDGAVTLASLQVGYLAGALWAFWQRGLLATRVGTHRQSHKTITIGADLAR